jgi:hypothetical protein
MPAIRTEGKTKPVSSYYRPQHIPNTLGAAALHVAPNFSNELTLLDATDNSDAKYQVRIEIEEPPRRNFLDILVGGDVVSVDENAKRHDSVRFKHLETLLVGQLNVPFVAVLRLPERGANDSL